MRKATWIILLMLLAIVAGFFVGMRIFNSKEEVAQIGNDTQNVVNNNRVNNVSHLEIQTSVEEEKISVNTEVIEEVYYVQCDHLVKNTKKDIKGIINMTEGELAKKYKDWEIKEFSKEKVVLYKEDYGFCNEHYLVKDEDGYVTIYGMDNDDKVSELIEYTDIETKYLTETDQEELKNGIKVYSEQKLNKLIEDFE